MSTPTLTSTQVALDVLAGLETAGLVEAGDAVIIAAGITPSRDTCQARQERRLALRTLAAGHGEVDRDRLHVVAAAILPDLDTDRRTDLVDELADACAVLDALEDGDPSVVEVFADLPANGVSHQVHRLVMCDEQAGVIEALLRAAVAA